MGVCCRAQVKLFRKHQVAKEIQANLLLRKYIDEDGKAVVEKFSKVCGELSGAIALPSRIVPSMSLQFDSGRVSEQVVGWGLGSASVRSKSVSSLASGLDADWASKHSMVVSAMCDGDDAGDDDSIVKESLCCIAGRCVCSGDGAKLHQLTRRFIVALKMFCPFKSDARQRLVDGELFCLLRGEDTASSDEVLEGQQVCEAQGSDNTVHPPKIQLRETVTGAVRGSHRCKLALSSVSVALASPNCGTGLWFPTL
jgi:hypothetical protein